MKYLIIIFTLIAGTIVLSFLLFPGNNPVPEGDIALSINGHDFSGKAITAESKKHGYHDTRSELYDSVITRELLIEEAQRQKIDKEENFRKALEDFYENSLVKILLERKNRELAVSVSGEEIDTYIEFLGKNVTFTRLESIPADPVSAQAAPGVKNTALFDDLAEPLRLLLASLKPGEFAVRFDTGSDKYALRLDSVTPAAQEIRVPPDRELVKQILEEYKREQLFIRWLADLKAKARIKIHN